MTRKFYEKNGGDDIRWVAPVPAFAEVLIGEGNLSDGNIDDARADLAWVDVYPAAAQTAIMAGTIADEIALDGPYLAA